METLKSPSFWIGMATNVVTFTLAIVLANAIIGGKK